MHVMIMRHGFAGNKIKDDDEADLDRELEPEGEDQVRAMAQHLEDNGLTPDAIYTSPVTRAKQTASILAEYFFGNPNRITVDQNLGESKPLEMAVVQRTQDKSSKRPLLVGHSGNMDRLHHLQGDFNPDPDPMATSEVRVVKIKRKNVEPGKKGEGPTGKWKEEQRILPSDANPGHQDLY